MRQEIEDFRNERGIPFLLHFTQEANLRSILRQGLLPRSVIDAHKMMCATNDPMRLDGRSSYNCTSVSFPNSPMFYRFQMQNPGIEWPILVLHPILMAQKDVLFCRHNAADARISNSSVNSLSSVTAFRGMFDEIEGLTSRADQSLKPCDPTDVQAEVLVPGIIEPEHIYAVVFPSNFVRDRNLQYLDNKKPYVNGRTGLYAKRHYYRTWGTGR